MSDLINVGSQHIKSDKADIVLCLKDNDKGQALQLDLCPALPLYQAWARTETASNQEDL